MTKPKRQIAPVRASWQALDVQGARLPGFWGHTLGLHGGAFRVVELPLVIDLACLLPPGSPVSPQSHAVTPAPCVAGKLYLIGGIATPGESRAQAGEELITVDTANWVCTRKFTTGAGPEFTDSHAAVIAGCLSQSAAQVTGAPSYNIPPDAGTNLGPRLYTFGGTDGGHKFNEVTNFRFLLC